jgi:hypothetical protein
MLSEIDGTPCAQRENGMHESVSEATTFACDGFLRLL